MVEELRRVMAFREKTILENVKAFASQQREREEKQKYDTTAMESSATPSASSLPPSIRDPRILGVCLSSRRNMCVHSEVASFDNRNKVDALCRNLTASFIREQHAQGAGVPICEYYEGYAAELHCTGVSLRPAQSLTRRLTRSPVTCCACQIRARGQGGGAAGRVLAGGPEGAGTGQGLVPVLLRALRHQPGQRGGVQLPVHAGPQDQRTCQQRDGEGKHSRVRRGAQHRQQSQQQQHTAAHSRERRIQPRTHCRRLSRACRCQSASRR